jgi:hypothetical protein
MIFKTAQTSLALIFSLWLGIAFLNLFFRKLPLSFFEKLSLSFGMGWGLISLLQFLFLYFGFQITILNTGAVILAIILAAFGFQKFSKESLPGVEGRPAVKEEESPIFSKLEKFCLIGIFIGCFYALLKTFIFPIIDDDGVCNFAWKAKVIYYSNLFHEPLAALVPRMRDTSGGDYPPLIPLSEHFITLFLNEWNDLYPKIIFPLFYFSFLAGFFYVVKRFINRYFAIVFTFLLSGLRFMSDQATWGVADLSFTYYYCISFFLILSWMRTENSSFFYLSAFFSAFAVWTKNEGIPSLAILFLIIVLFFFFSHRRKIAVLKEMFFYLMLEAALIIPVLYWKKLTAVTYPVLDLFSFSRILKNIEWLPMILNKLQQQLFGTPNRWNLLGYLFVLAICLNLKQIFKPLYLCLTLAIMLNYLLYIVVYLLDPFNDLAHYIAYSQNRVLMHFLPLMLFYAALTFYGWGNRRTAQV